MGLEIEGGFWKYTFVVGMTQYLHFTIAAPLHTRAYHTSSHTVSTAIWDFENDEMKLLIIYARL